MMITIETKGLRKVYGRGARAVNALNGLDLRIASGEVFGLLGRNGAGKTTALRLLAGVLTPTGGRVSVLGQDMRVAKARDRARFAYVPQEQQMDRSLTGEQIAHYLERFYPDWDGNKVTEVAARFHIPLDRRVGELSGGQQRLLSVMLALGGQPEVLLLDEPAAGLDPVARRELIDILVDLLSGDSGPTILLSTHIVADIERLANRVGMMSAGQLKLEADLDDLQQDCRRVQVLFESGVIPEDFAPAGVLRERRQGGMWSGVLRQDEAARNVLAGTPGAQVQMLPMGLEDLFVELFSQEDAA